MTTAKLSQNEKQLDWIESELPKQFSWYAIHSDNASQHFKCSKTLHWFSNLLSTRTWITKATYSFGCPGHGKGVWDGIGAFFFLVSLDFGNFALSGRCRHALSDEPTRTQQGRSSSAHSVWTYFTPAGSR